MTIGACLVVAGCGSSGGGRAPTTTVSLKQCFQDAGAKLATTAADLSFATIANLETDIAAVIDGTSVSSFKPTGGPDWRVYLGVPDAGEALRISSALSDPTSVVVAAYVAPGETASVRAAADACLDS